MPKGVYDRTPMLSVIHLFSGMGAMELGLKLAGISCHTVCHIERDAHAASVLVHHMNQGELDVAPIWGEVETFNGGRWRGRVDLVTASIPCQPWSSAGQRGGVSDDRWLWPEVFKVLADVGPRWFFLECTPGLNPRSGGGGLPYILEDLARLGFDAEWGLLSAAAVGAPHLRQRFWLLAYSRHSRLLADADRSRREVVGDRDRGERPRDHADGSSGTNVGDADRPRHLGASGDEPASEGEHGLRPTNTADLVDGAVEVVAYADSDERRAASGEPGELPGLASGRCQTVADAASVDEREPHNPVSAIARQDSRSDVGGSSGGRWPPRPDDTDGWRRWVAAGGPEPQIRRSTSRGSVQLGRPPGLADALHLLGNGLVPAVAAAALAALATRAGWGHLTTEDDRPLTT